MGHNSTLTPLEAEILGIQALGYIAGIPAELEKLLALTGMDVSQLGECTNSPECLAGIVNHLCQDESLLLAFTAETGRAPDEPARALVALNGSSRATREA